MKLSELIKHKTGIGFIFVGAKIEYIGNNAYPFGKITEINIKDGYVKIDWYDKNFENFGEDGFFEINYLTKENFVML